MFNTNYINIPIYFIRLKKTKYVKNGRMKKKHSVKVTYCANWIREYCI